MSKRVILSYLMVLFFSCDDESTHEKQNENILSVPNQEFISEVENISVEIHLISEDEIASFEIVLSDEPDKIAGVSASSVVCDSISSDEISDGFKISGVFSEPLLPGEYTLVIAEYLRTKNAAKKTTDTNNKLLLEEKTIEFGTDSVEIAIILENQDIVGGFQFDVSDEPNVMVGLSVSTELSGFTVSGNDNPNGSFRVLGFSMTGATIPVGEQTIVWIQYEIGQPENGEISLVLLNPTLSDPLGNPLDVATKDGSIVFVESISTVLSFQNAVLRDENGKKLSVEMLDGTVTLQ